MPINNVYTSYVKAAVSPDAQLVAFIPDLNNIAGTEIVITTIDGETVYKADGFFTRFVWLPGSDGIAVTELAEESNPDGPNREVSVRFLDGSVRHVAAGLHYDEVLGVSADGSTLFVTYALERGYQYEPRSFGWLDVASGYLKPVWAI